MLRGARTDASTRMASAWRRAGDRAAPGAARGSRRRALESSVAGAVALLALRAATGRGPTARAQEIASPPSSSAPAPVRSSSGGTTRVAMRHVDFHVADGVVLHVRRLDGEMHGVKDGIVDFDDPRSYETTIVSGEVALGGRDLTALMNDHVFAYRGAPLTHLHVELRDGLVRQTGTLHKGVDIPFELDAEPSLTPDGRIRLHPKRIRIFHVNGAALMRALGLSLQKMVDLSKAHGVAVDGNDLLLDATAVLPPPAIHGRLTSIRVVGDALVQQFGTAADSAAAAARPLALPDPSAANYMYYRGGTLHFGKLFMVDAEMLVVDTDPRDAFDFDNPHYERQLVAGSSRTLPDLGLEVWMPDARALSTGAKAALRR